LSRKANKAVLLCPSPFPL